MKWFCRILAICILCALLTACQCEHEFDWKITSEASCTHEGIRTNTCTLCNYSTTEPVPTVTHEYDAGVVTQEPTCTEQGIMTYTCIGCGDVQTEAIEVLAHSFGEPELTQEATCSVPGTMTHTCTACGYARNEDTETLEHTFGEAVVTKEANCKDEGEVSLVCTVCSYAQFVESIPKTDIHAYELKVIQASSCTQKGKGENECTVCGYAESCDLDLAKHNYDQGTVTAEATCAGDGSKTYTCKTCGHTKTESIPAEAHTWGDAACNSPVICTVCGYKNTKGFDHDYEKTDESSPSTGMAGQRLYKCSKCGKTKKEYYGKYGTYDLGAIKSAVNARAKELGLTPINSSETYAFSRSEFSREFHLVELDGGPSTLKERAVNYVDYFYESIQAQNVDPTTCNFWVIVTYNTNGAMGVGVFVIRMYAE